MIINTYLRLVLSADGDLLRGTFFETSGLDEGEGEGEDSVLVVLLLLLGILRGNCPKL